MVGTRVLVLAHPRADLLDASLRVQGVDEAVAAAIGEIGLAVAQPLPDGHVVRKLQVEGEILACAGTRLLDGASEHDAQLGGDDRERAEGVAHDGRVLDRHHVRVHAQRALARELHHLRAERGDDPRG